MIVSILIQNSDTVLWTLLQVLVSGWLVVLSVTSFVVQKPTRRKKADECTDPSLKSLPLIMSMLLQELYFFSRLASYGRCSRWFLLAQLSESSTEHDNLFSSKKTGLEVEKMLPALSRRWLPSWSMRWQHGNADRMDTCRDVLGHSYS